MQAHVEDIETAIQREEVVMFLYAQKLRVLSPWEVKGESVLGWDHHHEEPRRYRFDRIEEDVLPFNENYVRPA